MLGAIARLNVKAAFNVGALPLGPPGARHTVQSSINKRVHTRGGQHTLHDTDLRAQNPNLAHDNVYL